MVADSIPTDVDPEPSAIITLGEEALHWQKLESESDSDEDFVTGVEVGGAVLDADEGQLDGYLSTASSVSDSDEEFTLSYYQRRGARGGRGRRRGRSGVSAGSGNVKSETRAVSNSTEDIGYAAKPFSTTTQPPPLLSKVEGGRVLVKSGGPSLIKPHRKDGNSGRIIAGGSGGRGGLTTPSATHIQPPPGLIMPSIVQRGGKEGGKAPRRQPPPLVRKGEEPGHIPIQPKVFHPKIMLPSVDGEGGARSVVNSFGTSTPSPSFVTAGASRGIAKVVSSPAVPVPPVKRRPGRPRKDQSATLANSQTKKTARTAPYGLNKPHPKPQSSRSTRGQGAMKGMKMTQYEFQSQQQAQQSSAVSAAGGGVAMSPQLSQQHVVAAASPTSQQYQPLILSSGAASTLPMTPLQILPARTHQTTNPVQVQTYPAHSIPQQGGVIYLQGATPSLTQEQPTYVSKDGQLYQIMQQTRSIEDPNDNAKKISVIMQPQATVGGANFVQATAGGTTFVQAGEVGGFRYVTQLDGTPPSVAYTPDTREELQRKFRRLRQAIAIQQLDGLVPPVGGKRARQTRGEEEEEGSGGRQKEAKRRQTMSPGEVLCDVGGGSCDIGRETLSDELWTPDGLLPDNSNNNCNGGDSSCEEGVAKGGTVGVAEASSPGEEEPPPRKKGRPKGRSKLSKKACSDSAVSEGSGHDVVDDKDPLVNETPGHGWRLRKSAADPSHVTLPATMEEGLSERGCGRGKEDPVVSVSDVAVATTSSTGKPHTAKTSSKELIKCPKCDVTYTTKGGLKAHLASKHPPDLPVSIVA